MLAELGYLALALFAVGGVVATGWGAVFLVVAPDGRALPYDAALLAPGGEADARTRQHLTKLIRALRRGEPT